MEPSELQIPASAVEPLEAVLELSDEAFSTILATFDDRTDVREVAEAVGTALPDLRLDLPDLLRTLISLDLFREGREWTTTQIADQVARSDASPATTQEEAVRLMVRVEALLSSDPVVVAAAAARSALASERVFTRVDVLTDVRTVFGLEAYGRMPAVILHNLRISYQTQGQLQSVYVTLDEGDLDQLEEAISAARARASELADALGETRLLCIPSPWRAG